MDIALIESYILLFFTASFMGWCMEVLCKLIQFKRFIPSIFATVNRTERRTDPEHQALLGRITGIRLQHHDVRFQWKPYCMFPQQVLNQYESLFDIWTAPATNELSDEHWTIKQIPLLKRLQSVGVDPFRLTR